MSTYKVLHEMLSLTDKQILLWKLRRSGLSISEIASKLGVSRQAVHKNLQSVESKVYKALIAAAKASKVEIKEVNAHRGFLVGWSPGLRTEVYITFSSKNGIQIWFKHERVECKNCPLEEDCKRILFTEAEERGILLPKNEGLRPSELAKILFKELLR